MADWTRIQGKSVQSVASNSVAFDAPVTSGSIVYVSTLISDSLQVLTAVDDKGNIYDPVAAGPDASAGGQVVAGWLSRGPLFNGPQTITFTASGSPVSFFFKIAEEFALPTGALGACLDGTTWFSMPSTGLQGLTNLQTSPFQNTQNDVLLIAHVWDQDVTFGFGAGWTANITDLANIAFSASKIQATPSNTNQVTFSANANTAWGTCVGIAPVARGKLWTPVQRAFAPLVTATSVQMTLPRPATPGNIVLGGFGATGGLTTLLDDLGHDWASNLLVSAPGTGHAIWWTGVLGTAPQTFTINQTASAAIAATIAEFSPPQGRSKISVDAGGAVFNNYNGVAATTIATPNLTTLVDGDLIYSWISSEATVQDNPIGGQNMLNNWGQKNTDGYFVQSAKGVIAPSWNFASTTAALEFAVAISAIAAGGGLRGGFTGVPVIGKPNRVFRSLRGSLR